jgi:peptide/nickel transport system permease protein
VIARFVLRRIVSGALTLFFISLLMFVLFYVAPNDPARTLAGPQATFDVVEQIRRRLGLDQPLPERFGQFLGDLLHGDLGYSYYNQRPVLDTILDRLPVSASVAIGSAVLWTITGIPIGVTAARHPGSWRDRLGTTFVLAGLSFPTFVVGLLLLYFLFFRLTLLGIDWFPAGGYVPFTENPWEWARHLLLPWFTVAFATAATYARLTRGQLLEVFGEDYIRTARAKGLSEQRVVYRHGLRSAITPLFTQFGLDVALLLGGLVVTEQIFGLPGIGRLAVESVIRGDQPIIIGTVLFASLFVVVANVVVDVGYAFLDARVRIS